MRTPSRAGATVIGPLGQATGRDTSWSYAARPGFTWEPSVTSGDAASIIMESAWPLLPRGQLLGERALAVPTLRAGEDQTSQNAEMSTFDHGLSG
jgi:hypothetical protein